jgi:glyoxylase-like metal-dependent hydrolase (beta-lactamase superfamily II)
MRRATIGTVEIFALVDNVQAYPANAVYPTAGAALQTYRHYLDAESRVVLNFASFLVRDGSDVILVDTGWGPEHQGELMNELLEAGVASTDISTVIFTHLHGDHTGWNIDRSSGAPVFPNARYLVPQADWDYYSAITPPPDSFTRDVAPLERTGCIEFIGDGRRLSPACVTVATPGHTPGHTSIAITAGSERGFILGDVCISPIDVEEPEWQSSFDWDHPTAAATRRKTLERLVADGALVGASHLPVPGLGHVVERGSRRAWQALE